MNKEHCLLCYPFVLLVVWILTWYIEICQFHDSIRLFFQFLACNVQLCCFLFPFIAEELFYKFFSSRGNWPSAYENSMQFPFEWWCSWSLTCLHTAFAVSFFLFILILIVRPFFHAPIRYELYVGQPPFYTNSVYALIRHIVKVHFSTIWSPLLKIFFSLIKC